MNGDSNNLDKRIKKSKTALKNSLISLMKMKDFKEITITDIVQLADVNRGTFYKHYQYKEELLEEIINDVTTDLIASYREPYKNCEIFELKCLTASAIKIFEHVEKYSNFYTLVVKSTELCGFQTKLCAILKRLSMQDLIDCSPNLKINKDLQSSYQAYAILGMIIEWIDSGFKYSPSYMAEQLLEIIKKSNANTAYKSTLHY